MVPVMSHQCSKSAARSASHLSASSRSAAAAAHNHFRLSSSSTSPSSTTPPGQTTKYPSRFSNNFTTISSSRSFSTTARSPAARMSSMPAQQGHSQACCNIPPVISKGYDGKGAYETIGDYKTYVTGPSDTKKGILMVYDIFGYFPQTIQGADILATSNDEQKHRVFMPDWFADDACPIEWYPPDNDEKAEKLGKWFGKHPPHGCAEKIPGYIKAVKAKYPEITEWAILGFCWGGKVVSLVTSSNDNPFKVGAEIHPAMVDPKEAESIKVPLIMLGSKDEPDEDIKAFGDKLTGPKHIESFNDQVHGWMAARGDLEDPRVKEEYIRGYKTVLQFFGQHL